jgi:hypothetical protein
MHLFGSVADKVLRGSPTPLLQQQTASDEMDVQ